MLGLRWLVALVCVQAMPDLQTVENLQRITLTANYDSIEPKTNLVKIMDTGPIVGNPSNTPTPRPQPPPIDIATERDSWFTRVELLNACGMRPCNGTEHCWGNPSNFLADPNTARPDGSHHEYCCAFQKPADPPSDRTKLLPSIEECRITDGSRPTGDGWCTSGDEGEGAMTGAQRCAAHGGEYVWSYAHGKLFSPDGKILSLAQATGRFWRTLHSGLSPSSKNDACRGVDGQEWCCGQGDCLWGREGWYCDFPQSYNHELCFPPGKIACEGIDGVHWCCSQGECVWSPQSAWGCVFPDKFTQNMCFPVGPATYLTPDEMSALFGDMNAAAASLRKLAGMLTTITSENSITVAQMQQIRKVLTIAPVAVDGMQTLSGAFPDINFARSAGSAASAAVNLFNTPSNEGDAFAGAGTLAQLMATWNDQLDMTPPAEEILVETS